MPTPSPTPDYVAATSLLRSPLRAGNVAPDTAQTIYWLGLIVDLYPKLSDSEQLLLDAAYALDAPEGSLSLRRIVRALDQPNFHALTEAMFVSRDEFLDCDVDWSADEPSARIRPARSVRRRKASDASRRG